jgi:hypothetical protein
VDPKFNGLDFVIRSTPDCKLEGAFVVLPSKWKPWITSHLSHSRASGSQSWRERDSKHLEAAATKRSLNSLMDHTPTSKQCAFAAALSLRRNDEWLPPHTTLFLRLAFQHCLEDSARTDPAIRTPIDPTHYLAQGTAPLPRQPTESERQRHHPLCLRTACASRPRGERRSAASRDRRMESSSRIGLPWWWLHHGQPARTGAVRFHDVA